MLKIYILTFFIDYRVSLLSKRYLTAKGIFPKLKKRTIRYVRTDGLTDTYDRKVSLLIKYRKPVFRFEL